MPDDNGGPAQSEPNNEGGKFWQKVVLALIGVISAALVAYIYTRKPQQPEGPTALPHLTVTVYDAATYKGLPQSKLQLFTPDGGNEQDITDSSGQHVFVIQNAGLVGNVAKLQIAKTGYDDYSREVIIEAGYTTKNYYLTPVAAQKVQVAAPVNPPAAIAAHIDQVLPMRVALLATGANRQIEQVNESGPKPVGVGAAFSPWYELCSNALPPGYKIANVDFKLSGDRSCDAAAECRPTVRTDQVACYKFRMQGHNEKVPFARPSLSTGILKVTLQKQ